MLKESEQRLKEGHWPAGLDRAVVRKCAAGRMPHAGNREPAGLLAGWMATHTLTPLPCTALGPPLPAQVLGVHLAKTDYNLKVDPGVVRCCITKRQQTRNSSLRLNTMGETEREEVGVSGNCTLGRCDVCIASQSSSQQMR